MTISKSGLGTLNISVNQNLSCFREKCVEDPLIGLDIGAVKAKFGRRFLELTIIIGQRDPLLMIALGAPKDEYNLEAATILPQLDKTQSEIEVYKVVSKEFKRWFNDLDLPGEYEILARDIYKWVQKKQLSNS